MLGTNNFTLPILKIDLSDRTLIKYDIFEFNVDFPPRGTPIGIVTQYCEHQNMSYITQSTNKIPCNNAFTYVTRTNVIILSIGRKEPTTVQQVLESMLIHKLTVKFKSVHFITA